MGKTYTDDERARVLTAAEEGDNWRLVALQKGVQLETARRWARRSKITGNFTATPGGSHNRKLKEGHLDFLEDCLSENCLLTPSQMREHLFDEFGVRVEVQTVSANTEGRCFTVKKTHRDNNHRNTPENKAKRQEGSRNYGWSKAGTRAVDMNASNKGRNIYVVACISRDGVEYHERRFGSFDNAASNEYMCAMLRDQATREPLSNFGVVLDSEPCHSRVESVFEEPELTGAACLRLGPYSPMLNEIENVFSAYKAAVKRYMAVNRTSILNVPEGMTIQDHRSSFLLHAANNIFREVVSSQLCRKCIHHAFAFIVDAILMKDTQIGE